MKLILYYSSLVLLLLSCIQCSNYSNVSEDLESANSPIASIETKIAKITEDSSILTELNIEASINHKNLQIFIIKGKTTADNLVYTPLQEAMKEKWVEIIETSNVNELAITNNSNKTIFIHAGDIVKGGKQDRTLAYDMVIAPKVKNEKLSSFCVESDRWHQRGEENVAGFTSNDNMLTSRNLKIASKEVNSQTHVWTEVAEQQTKLSANVSTHYSISVDVKDNASASSLELTLDNKELKELKKLYKETFKDIDLNSVTGFACAINGELYSIDIYNNQQLFSDLWDKLLGSSIIEAISDLDTEADAPTYLSLQALKESLTIANKAKQISKTLNPRTEWLSIEDSTKILFTSLDKGNESKWVHQNLIIRDGNTVHKPGSQLLFNREQNQNVFLNELEAIDED
jgi:hypothetical protein